MSVKLKIAEPGGIYFITSTCYKCLRLFDIADSMGMVRGATNQGMREKQNLLMLR